MGNDWLLWRERQKELWEDDYDVDIGLNEKDFNPDLGNLLWVYTRAAKRLSQWLRVYNTGNVTLRVKIVMVIDERNYMLRKTKSVSFQFIYVEVRGKTPSGRHNCLFLLSVSQDISVSSRGPTTAPVFPAHPSFAWLQRNIAEIPLWEGSRASVLRRQPEKAWPRAWPTSGTSWKASVDTRNQWKQKEEGRGGPATAGAGQAEGDSAKCTDEPLSDLSLARRGGGRR